MKGLAEELAPAGCRALLVLAESSRDPDLAPFVGAVHLGSSFLLAPAEGAAALGYLTAMERDEAAATGLEPLAPEALGVEELRRESGSEAEMWAGLLRRALATLEIEPGRLALAGRSSAGLAVEVCSRLAGEGWEFVDGRRTVLRLRREKGESQIAAARKAAQGACAALRRVAALLAACRVRRGALELEGAALTVGRLRSAIAVELASFGLEQPAGNIVAPGADAGVPHSAGLDAAPIEPHRSLVVDLYPKGELFADCTRTFCVGEPLPALAAAHALVRQALAEAHERTAVGARGWDLQRRTCETLAAAGHPTPVTHPGTHEGYVHGLGHGVGYEIHELPSFRRRAEEDGVLAAGDLLTLEPGLYYPEHPEGGFGIRLEDLVVLTEAGPENLTPLPYDLDPRAW